MSRLPSADPQADPALAEVYGEIQATRGFVSNVLRSFGHAPEGLRHLARLGAYTKYQTDLPERLRELTIVCAARGVAYAWQHHSVLAVQAGIPQSAIDDIGAGRAPAALPAPEQAIARFVAELFSPQSVSDAAMQLMKEHYSPRQITDVLLSATYYRTLATAVLAFRVEMEPPEVFEVEKKWQKAHIDSQKQR
jgi:4-carboxymuconolactone decarboxylase